MQKLTPAERKALRATRHAAQQACVAHHAELLSRLREIPAAQRQRHLRVVAPVALAATRGHAQAPARFSPPALLAPMVHTRAAPASMPALLRSALRPLWQAARMLTLPAIGRASF